MAETISRRMARYARELRFEDIPDKVVYAVKRFLLDSIACAFGGYKTADVSALLSIYRKMGGHEEASVIGGGDRLPAVNATLLNSLMVRALDYNDICWKEDPSHPSDLIPAVLALAECEGLTAKDAIVGVVLAYDFEMRLCEFARPGLRERMWHHATLTQFAAPLAAGRMLGLSEDQLVNAIGISGAHNYTPGAATAGKLSMMKNTVDPMAVQSGVMAALLAREGYTGTEAIFEGKEGLMDVMGPEWNESILFEGLGEEFRILQCSMKAFPTEALTHSHITAALKVVKEHDIRVDDIKEVRVTTIARAVDILFDPEKYKPDSRETADHSLPYCIAAALVDRQITTDQFSEDRIDAPEIQRVLQKIQGEASEEFEEMFPEKQPSRVTITLQDGTTHSAEVEYPKGDPREPMTDEEIKTKFRALADNLIIPDRQEEIIDRIMAFEHEENMHAFMQDLAVSRGAQ